MQEALLKLATEQSLPIALLMIIAYVLWKTSRKDAQEKEARIVALEAEFRTCIQKNQEEVKGIMRANSERNEQVVRLMEHTTGVVEECTLVMKQFARNLACSR